MRLLRALAIAGGTLLFACVDETAAPKPSALTDASDDGGQCRPSSGIDITIAVGVPDAARACDEEFLFEVPKGAPPAYCVPPCVWNAVQSCAKAEAASCVQRPGGVGAVAPLLCDLDGRWQFERKRLRSGAWQTQLRLKGQVCATAIWGGDDASGDLREYRHGGRPIAVGMQDAILCGPVTVAELQARPDDASAPACSRVYPLEPSRAECAKWASLLDLQPLCQSFADGG